MKREWKGILGIMVLALFLNACLAAKREQGGNGGPEKPEGLAEHAGADGNNSSGVRPEECFWCGETGAEAAPYWGQENVGFISLNSFEIAYVGINRYDDFGGRVNEHAGGTMVRLEHAGEDGFSAFIFENTDRGFADGTITLNEDASLHAAQAAQHVCKDCMERLYEMGADEEACGVGIVNFATGEYRLLRPDGGGFDFGDFYVFCDFRDGKKDGEMGFLIMHCPVRGG
ncbi:MAG: hypothetical protein HFI39_11560 [Lachnospiraceae bacterium]|nr:hypothetical protein [Lachnospiraceae bacterium]